MALAKCGIGIGSMARMAHSCMQASDHEMVAVTCSVSVSVCQCVSLPLAIPDMLDGERCQHNRREGIDC